MQASKESSSISNNFIFQSNSNVYLNSSGTSLPVLPTLKFQYSYSTKSTLPSAPSTMDSESSSSTSLSAIGVSHTTSTEAEKSTSSTSASSSTPSPAELHQLLLSSAKSSLETKASKLKFSLPSSVPSLPLHHEPKGKRRNNKTENQDGYNKEFFTNRDAIQKVFSQRNSFSEICMRCNKPCEKLSWSISKHGTDGVTQNLPLNDSCLITNQLAGGLEECCYSCYQRIVTENRSTILSFFPATVDQDNMQNPL